MHFQSGVLDKTRIVSNILMLVLVAGNIFFSIQYTEGIKQQEDQAAQTVDQDATRIQSARFLKEFIDIVLGGSGTISFDDRVKLESDVRQLGDSALVNQWTDFVNSKAGSADQQASLVKFLSMLTNKML
jgi:hypothetical protein